MGPRDRGPVKTRLVDRAPCHDIVLKGSELDKDGHGA